MPRLAPVARNTCCLLFPSQISRNHPFFFFHFRVFNSFPKYFIDVKTFFLLLNWYESFFVSVKFFPSYFDEDRTCRPTTELFLSIKERPSFSSNRSPPSSLEEGYPILRCPFRYHFLPPSMMHNALPLPLKIDYVQPFLLTSSLFTFFPC